MHTDAFCTVDGVEIHYTAWGEATAPPVVCVHGLSRVGRDFDPLARELADEYRVLCPDLPGRGLSEWAPGRYGPAAMAASLAGFCEALGLESIRWVGTSTGGRLGLRLAASALSDRTEGLVLNDVGPADERTGGGERAERVVEYLSDPPTRRTLSGLESYYRDTYADFGEMTAAEWRRFTRTSARRRDDGTWTPGYDTRIVEPAVRGDSEVDPWALWADLDVPTLVLRGERSDLLSRETCREMCERRPETERLVVGDCGHAPALNTDRQQDAIRSILAA
jgi:pimeloyl-ACP methyl ester carboxylesterase